MGRNRQLPKLRRKVQVLLVLYGLALMAIGLATIPLQVEIAVLENVAGEGSALEEVWPAMAHWISRVQEGVSRAYGTYPLLQYGTDWLAFAHVVIGIALLGAARAPLRNVWLVEWGMIACILVVPTALIFGAVRGIPFFWRLVDSSFGLFGLIPLWLALRGIRQVMALERA